MAKLRENDKKITRVSWLLSQAREYKDHYTLIE